MKGACATRTVLARLGRRPEMGVPVALATACLAWGPVTGLGLTRAIAAGVVSALVAASVVLVHRIEEIVSFAQFGLAALAAATLGTAAGPVGVAMIAPMVLIGSAGVTWAQGRWVFARLARSPRVVGTLAGMAAMQILLAARLWWGQEPDNDWVVPLGRYAIAIGGVLLVAVLPVLLRPLLREGAPPAGISGAAGLLAGGAGLFAALLSASGPGPLSGVTIADFPVVGMATAMVAAAMGGFRDLSTAIVSAFALNVAWETSNAAFGSSHAYQLALMPLLSAALLLRPRRPASSVVDSAAIADPVWPGSLVTVLKGMQTQLAVAVAVGVPVLAIVAGRRPIVAELAGYCLVALSLMMLMGWIGQVTLGQLGFAALGGWITLASGLPTAFGVLLGALAGTVLSPLVAYTAIRHSGVPAPVTSLTWGLFAYTLFTSPDLLGLDRLMSSSGAPLTATGSRSPDFVVGVAVVVCLGAVAVVGRTKFGRVLAAARLDPGVARRADMVLPRARLTALLLTGFVAATGGGLLAVAQRGLIPSSYATDSGVRLVTSTGTGGIGTVAGPILGTLVFGAVTLLCATPAVRFLVTGALGVSVLLSDTAGLVGLASRLRRLRAPRIAPAVPPPPPEDAAALNDSKI